MTDQGLVCSECGAVPSGRPKTWKRCVTIGCQKKSVLCNACWTENSKGNRNVELYCAGCKKTSTFTNERLIKLPRLTLLPILLFTFFIPGYIWKIIGMVPEEKFTWAPDLSHMTQSFVLTVLGTLVLLLMASCSFCVGYPISYACKRLGWNINFV